MGRKAIFSVGRKVEIIGPCVHPYIEKTGIIKKIENEDKNPNQILPYLVEFDDGKTHWFDEDEMKGK